MKTAIILAFFFWEIQIGDFSPLLNSTNISLDTSISETKKPSSDSCPHTRGLDGRDGREGVPGPAGPAGRDGRDGLVGPQGPPGLQGPVGPEGSAGPVGPEGPAGHIGPEGPAGAVGPAGPAGSTGLEGPAGPEGPPGLQGPPGIRGPRGEPGSDAPASRGVVYTRWGSSSCPVVAGTTLVYAGRAAGTFRSTSGGGAIISACHQIHSTPFPLGVEYRAIFVYMELNMKTHCKAQMTTMCPVLCV